MAKLPAHMRLISIKCEDGETRAEIQIDWMHPDAWPPVTRRLALIAVTRMGRN